MVISKFSLVLVVTLFVVEVSSKLFEPWVVSVLLSSTVVLTAAVVDGGNGDGVVFVHPQTRRLGGSGTHMRL